MTRTDELDPADANAPAAQNRRGDWIQTYTGKRFYPLDPRPEDVDVRDIAHALSNLCRFAGHTKTAYSVAQHCVLAARLAPPASKLAALLHDANEAYMGDVARPWKRYLWVRVDGWEGTFRDAEARLLDVILRALNCSPRDVEYVWAPIKKIDELLLVTEARDFMSPLADGWRHHTRNGYEILPEPISPWPPGRASYEFVRQFVELGGVVPPAR